MIYERDGKIWREDDKELLCIEPWGPDAVRVRATQCRGFNDEDLSALLPPAPSESSVTERDGNWVLENGRIRAILLSNGRIVYENERGEVILEEYQRIRKLAQFGKETMKEFKSSLKILPRAFRPVYGTDNYRLEARFEPQEGEKIFGMGQYQQPYLDVKGCTLELAHRNSQASVPFALSSRGYGFLWNNPAIGTVTFGKNMTVWTAETTKQLDYWVCAGDTPAQIVERYADATGHAPMMPEFGLGFWQCKLRYQTQEELLGVAREYHRRGIPLDVIVIDYFHWPHAGDWCLDPTYWPDPKAMVEELESMGIKLMVSVWPTVDLDSPNYPEMAERRMLVRTEAGRRGGILMGACLIDPTNPDTRSYVWDKIKQGYYDAGIRLFWLDEAEPEFSEYDFWNYRYWRGTDLEVGNVYPVDYARMVYDGQRAEGQEDIVNLLRCAWAGSQRYGVLTWSGDVDSSFRALRSQLRAGLNMGLSGIPWWTTDIGGFQGGDVRDETFRELLLRWFEWATFLPVMRLHGYREPVKAPLSDHGGGKQNSGADNEIWSYTPEMYEVFKAHIELRERLRPYTRSLMAEAHEKGTPVIRPLFYQYPEDAHAWDVDDEYLFGPDVLVAPILEEGAREREVYLPAGSWRCALDGSVAEGPATVTAQAPVEAIPVFVRAGALEGVL